MVSRWWSRVKQAYWLIPAVCVVSTGPLSYVALRIDQRLRDSGWTFAFGGGPESARSLLSTISASMLSLTALVFSITIVVLQLASSQFSPRALSVFLRDRQNQVTLGVFLATYVFSLVALREVRAEGNGQFVPGVTIGLAFVLVLASIALFVAYIHHIATSIQVGTVIERIERQTRAALQRDFPSPLGEAPCPRQPPAAGLSAQVIHSDTAGTFAGVNVDRMFELAGERQLVIRVFPKPGDFITHHCAVIAIDGNCELSADQWLATVDVVDQRDDFDDVDLGLRRILDLAIKALSPAVNDPSTAVQCMDRLHDLLGELARREYPPERHVNDEGRVWVLMARTRWSDHVAMVIDGLRHWGQDSPEVRARLADMVNDLVSTVPDARRPPLQERVTSIDD